MPERYELFLERAAADLVKRLRDKRRRTVFDFLDLLVRDPFIDGGIRFEDRKGRLLQKVTVAGLVMTFHVDYALKEIKILTVQSVD